MKNIALTTLLSLLAISLSAGKPERTLDSLLSVYDAEIEKADQYLSQREAQIDSVRMLLRTDTSSVDWTLAMANLFAPYRSDSAVLYYKRAMIFSGETVPDDITDAYLQSVDRTSGGDGHYMLDSTRLSDPDSHEFAIFAFNQYVALRDNGDSIGSMIWLTRSAIADVRAAVTDNGSSWTLAEALYADGQLERACKYIEYSSRNADTFNARLRYIQINPLTHLITSAYQERLRTKNRNLRLTMAALLLLLITVIWMAVQSQSKNRSLSRLNESLSQMNRTREEYICAYIEEQSAEIRRIHRESRRAGALDSDEKMKAQLDQFYQRFDTTFLRLYPNFVEEFNSLLKYEARIHPPKGQLTPELRIFALIRMGITRSTRIAELLCYSNNTIYNYRSRVKNNAIGNRDEFESAIRML